MPRTKSALQKWQDLERSALRRLGKEIFEGKPNDLKNLAISAGVATDKAQKLRAEPRSKRVATWDDRDTVDALAHKLAGALGYVLHKGDTTPLDQPGGHADDGAVNT